MDDIVQHLKRLEDISRVVQRFILGRGDVSDLGAIKNAIEIWNIIRSRIAMEYRAEQTRLSKASENEWSDIITLLGHMTDLKHLALRVGMALQPTEQIDHPLLVVENEQEDVSSGSDFVSSEFQAKFAINPKYFHHFTMSKYILMRDQFLASARDIAQSIVQITSIATKT